MVRYYYFRMLRTKASQSYKHVYTIYLSDEDFACVKPPPKKARMAINDPDCERNLSASPNEVVDLTSSGSKKRLQKTFIYFFSSKRILSPIIQNLHMDHCVYKYVMAPLCYFRASLEDRLYEKEMETALSSSLPDSSRTQAGEPTTKRGECTTAAV